jgi:AraC-like DNA-binding protein
MRPAPAEPATPPLPRVRAVAANGVESFIAETGGSVPAVLTRAGLQAKALADPLHPLPLAAYCALFEQAARQTGMESFGLRFGLRRDIRTLGELGELALSAPTLAAALAALCRFFPALQDSSSLVLRRVGPLVALEYQIRDGRIVHRRQDAELTLGVVVGLLRRVLGEDWAPEEVQFEHARPADHAAPEALLRAPVCYAAPTNAVIFAAAVLSTPMPAPDVARAPLLAARLAGRVAEGPPDDLIGCVQQQIRAALPGGQTGLETVAARLGTTESSLYRHLRDRGVAYSDLLAGLRRELALAHLAAPHLPLTEIALLLGYSELSAFSRAFRAWTGVSPAAYRRRLRTGAAS